MVGDMILHTVAFATRHPAGSPAETAFLQAGAELARLPMVRNFRTYRQVCTKNDFAFGFAMEFASQADYDAYNRHPVHVDFVERRWKAEVVRFLELDYVDYRSA